jgi:transposase-like protein
LEAEIRNYLEKFTSVTDASTQSMVVRNGYHREREIAVGAGMIAVEVPRTRNRHGDSENFVSQLIPPYMRRSVTIDEAVPLLYLRGLSNGDMLPALEKLFGKGIRGLSPANVTRLKGIWKKEYEQWRQRDLSDKRYVYVWVDGIHLQVSMSDSNLCTLVMIGALPNGKKELIAVEGGYRESEESWSTVLRGLRTRGFLAPNLFVGDGALGFWKAVKNTYPTSKWQRCWVHKLRNVLDKLPKSVQEQAKTMLHDIYLAPDKASALKAYKQFMASFSVKYPKATECLEKDKNILFTFFDFPAEHWQHIRTTNVIESTFSTVRLRTRKTRGKGTPTSVLLMVFKLLDQATMRWQKLRGSKLLLKVVKNVPFEDGKEMKLAA